MEEILVIKNVTGIEIFERGAKLVISYELKPHLEELSENEIIEMYLAKTL